MSEASIEMNVLLSRIAGEISGLYQVAVAAEEGVTGLLLEKTADRGAVAAAIQELDRLSQTLDCLSQVVLSLSVNCARATPVDREKLAARVKLLSLSQRLLSEPHAAHDPGAIELF